MEWLQLQQMKEVKAEVNIIQMDLNPIKEPLDEPDLSREGDTSGTVSDDGILIIWPIDYNSCLVIVTFYIN